METRVVTTSVPDSKSNPNPWIGNLICPTPVSLLVGLAGSESHDWLWRQRTLWTYLWKNVLCISLKKYVWANFVKKIHKLERKYFLGKCYMYFHGEEKTRWYEARCTSLLLLTPALCQRTYEWIPIKNIRIYVSISVAEHSSLSSAAKMAMKIFVKRVFTIFVTNASFLPIIANLQI